MSWNEARAKQRIENHLTTVPTFSENITLAENRRLVLDARLLDRLPTRRAFVVAGSHVYGQLLDFDNIVSEANGESEGSHRRVLEFLHMHYRLWDAIVDKEDADRIDYHGARLHAVVTSPEGDAAGQVMRAIALAEKLTNATKRVATAYGFPARVRFGIDQGRCLAMSTGRSHEKDTLFLGSPANHAAKLAAESTEEGIYLAPAARALLAQHDLERSLGGSYRPKRELLAEAAGRYAFDNVDRAADRVVADRANTPKFSFFRPEPPLSNLKFADLMPSRTARLGMASIFADIDGYTAFVDNCIKGGSDAIKRAATGIHVIREELNDVLKEDFRGKRIRFIGDCIHGVLAAGENADDPRTAIRQSALCAAAMRSSFNLCQKMVPGLGELDLAVGIEYGPTPATRLGDVGNDSIRCAASRAVVDSERQQQAIEHGGVRLGPVARAHAEVSVARYFSEAIIVPTYDDAAELLGEISAPAVAIAREDRSARPYFGNSR